MSRFQAPKGTRDLLPPATAVWSAVERRARRILSDYGYREIRTPIFEEAELFARGVGESSDIVGKEMYTFTDKGGRTLALRPESTAGVCRAYVEHGMRSWPQPVKLFYIGPQFRYERPQKGRYRQFHQIGAELLGKEGPEADAEVVLLLVRFLGALNFGALEVRLNTVGDAASRHSFREALVAYLRPLAGELGEDSRRRLTTNPLRILDTKVPEERKLLEGAPRLESYLTGKSRGHFEAVLAHLKAFDVRIRVEPGLVRGLDYYTNTVFEVAAEGLGAQDAICGGGAYEQLVEQLGGAPTYGVGFAIGEDRLIEALPPDSPARRRRRGPVVVVPVGKFEGGAVSPVFSLVEEIRRRGFGAVDGRKDKAYELADSLNAPLIVYLGEDELSGDTLSVRDTATRQTETMPRASFFSYLKSFLAAGSR